MPDFTEKTRLDQALVERGFARSRASARDAIKRGIVLVEGVPVSKPARPVSAQCKIELSEDPSPFVSRGGLKLVHGLKEFSLDVAGKTAIDLGASTGGFSDVLLQNGIAKLYAIDVGTAQFHDSLRADPRVSVLENLNAKHVNETHVPETVDLIVCDVSFISLRKALPAVMKLAGNKADMIALIKPQFELGPEHIGKGGIVRDMGLRNKAVEDIKNWVNGQENWFCKQICPSPITGPDGNKEFLVHAVKR